MVEVGGDADLQNPGRGNDGSEIETICCWRRPKAPTVAAQVSRLSSGRCRTPSGRCKKQHPDRIWLRKLDGTSVYKTVWCVERPDEFVMGQCLGTLPTSARLAARRENFAKKSQNSTAPTPGRRRTRASRAAILSKPTRERWTAGPMPAFGLPLTRTPSLGPRTAQLPRGNFHRRSRLGLPAPRQPLRAIGSWAGDASCVLVFSMRARARSIRVISPW